MIPSRQRPLAFLQMSLCIELQHHPRNHSRVENLTSEILGHPGLQQRVTEHARRVRPAITPAPYQQDFKYGIPRRKIIRVKNKDREVWMPTDEDYVQQLYLLLGIVAPITESIGGKHSHAFRKGKSIDSAIAEVITAVRNNAGQDPQIRQEDITGCFPNLPIRMGNQYWPHQTAVAIQDIHLRYREATIRFGTKAQGMPQGYPIVPSVANIVIEHIIRPIREYYRRWNVAIVVYCDDITIVGSRRHATAARKRLEQALASHGMELHPRKSRTAYPRPGNAIELLGLVLSWENAALRPTIAARPSAYDNLSQRIAEADTLTMSKTIIRGWTHAYAMCNDPDHKTKAQQAVQDGYRKQSERAHSRFHSPQF